MKKILKLYLITLVAILTLSFLFCGIIEINDRTSYISSGIKQDVIKAQNLKGKRVISFEENDNTLNKEKIKSIMDVAKYCCVPPAGCVISILEKSFEQ